jgi:hypothetical protein
MRQKPRARGAAAPSSSPSTKVSEVRVDQTHSGPRRPTQDTNLTKFASNRGQDRRARMKRENRAAARVRLVGERRKAMKGTGMGAQRKARTAPSDEVGQCDEN